MSELWLDPFAGISGDMFLGALLDLGLSWSDLQADVRALRVPVGALTRRRVRRGALNGIRVLLHLPKTVQPARGLADLRRLLQRAPLPALVKQSAFAVFKRLAEVEAKLHQCPVAKIHFHELGALDALVEVVGVCAGLRRLGIERIQTAAINVGSGRIRSQHGLLPVPAPATLELLKGFAVFSDGPAAEHTTPTGAALVSVLAGGQDGLPVFAVEKIGYGAGQREWPDFPNLLRAAIVRSPSAQNRNWKEEEVCVLTAAVDDATPQILGYTMERLLQAGALDVIIQPAGMKKNRSGHRLEVICRPEQTQKLAALVFYETPTLGVRVCRQTRFWLERRIGSVKVRGHRIRLKWGSLGPKGTTAMPEYEDVKACAQATGQPLRRIMDEALRQNTILRSLKKDSHERIQ